MSAGLRDVAPLLERDAALHALDGVLDRVADGEGGALLIEGEAGLGKTRLLEEVSLRAAQRGLIVARASGAEGERVMAWGVAHQLGHRLLAGRSEEAAALLAGVPPVATGLFGGPALARGERTEDELSLAHAMFTVLGRIAESAPVVLCVDDLHWCDISSLRLLLYLLQRLDDLPLCLVMARRPNEPGEESERGAAIAAHPAVRIVPVAPLGRGAVSQLARGRLGDLAAEDLVDACLEMTGGNPFYLHELMLSLGEELPGDAIADAGALVLRLRRSVPRTVAVAVALRIGRLGAGAAGLARAVAVLGDGASLRHAAALAGLDAGEAARDADALARAQILAPGEPLEFVHPLLRAVVDAELGPGERANLHRRAADLLDAGGEPVTRLGAHLLQTIPSGDPWVVSRLRAAGGLSMAAAAAGSAVRYLRRALEEPPSPQQRGALLGELGAAEAAAGRPEAADRFAEAAALAEPGSPRARLMLARARALHADGRHPQAIAAIDDGLAELAAATTDAEEIAVHDELQALYVAIALLVPELLGEAQRRVSVVLGRDHTTDTHGRRAILAQSAGWAAVTGVPAPEVAALAESGWGDGQLLADETSAGLAWTFITGAYTQSGAFARSVVVADAALADAHRRSDPLAMALGLYVRACPRLMLGDVSGAIDDLRAALHARRYGWRQYARAAAGYCAGALVVAGDLDGAEAVLAEHEADLDPGRDLEDVALLGARAQVHLAHGRASAALADARVVRDAHDVASWFCGTWRDVGALAALALGDAGEARAFAERELDRGRRADVPYLRVNGLRLLGLVAGGEEGIGLLSEALGANDAEDPDLTTLLTLVDLGAALRRANRRAEARPHLERAADVAHRRGAMTIYERARTELAATGARPRRAALLSGPDSLTASERRIAELAASGKTNREIAQTLFVTGKTVEYHLRNVYAKLRISGRAGLAAALRG